MLFEEIKSSKWLRFSCGNGSVLVLSLCVMDLGMFVIGNGNLLNSHYYIIGGGMWMCLVRKKIRLVGINKSYFFQVVPPENEFHS